MTDDDFPADAPASAAPHSAPIAGPRRPPDVELARDPAAAAYLRWRAIEDEHLPTSGAAARTAERDWLERSAAAEAAVVEARATGPRGVAAKLRLIRESEGTRHEGRLLDQAVAELERWLGFAALTPN